jgi:RNA polymerase sigma-70 factor, ECF subfamily
MVRCLDHGAALVSGAVGAPLVLAFADRRLSGVIALTIRDDSMLKIEASVDPWEAAGLR